MRLLLLLALLVSCAAPEADFKTYEAVRAIGRCPACGQEHEVTVLREIPHA